MLLSKCAVCESKKQKFIKEEEASGLLSSLGIKASLSKVPLVGTLLLSEYKMSEIINKFLLPGDKFMPEIHLRQPVFKYIVLVEHLPKTKKEYKNLKKQKINDIFIKMN